MGLNLSQFEYRGSDNCLITPQIILAIGSLLPMKGFDVLINALAILKSRGECFKCVIIGEGDERSKLEVLIRDFSLENVQLIGALSFEMIKEYLAQATILVMPSRFSSEGVDGIPTVLIEAMASGVPVVSTRFVGIPELVVHDFSGLLAEPGDKNDLAKQIERLLTDAQLHSFLRINAIKTIRDEYDIKKNVRLLSNEIDRITK